MATMFDARALAALNVAMAPPGEQFGLAQSQMEEGIKSGIPALEIIKPGIPAIDAGSGQVTPSLQISVTETDTFSSAPSPVIPQGLHVSFKDLSYTVQVCGKAIWSKVPLKLLVNVNGHFQPGEMTALMGPSGCGKTTLLDVISGRKTCGTIDGEVLYGISMASKSFLSRNTGYVEQFDTLVDNLTVKDMLLYTANMKLPSSKTKQEKLEVVDSIIAKMNLEMCVGTVIGNASQRGISGGQAKRVNIAVSIITNPLVLYLDEPTSGLDSFTSDEVMTFVHKLSKEGVTICATIHSPSPFTFQLFERLLLLVSGRIAYFGDNGNACVDYFIKSGLMPTEEKIPEEYQQAEWIVRFVTDAGNRGHGEALATAFTKSQTGRKLYTSVIVMRRAHTFETELIGHVQMLTVEGLEEDNPRRGQATTVAMLEALKYMFWFRTLRNFTDGLFISARVVDKFIAGGIIMSLFKSLGGNSDIGDRLQLSAAFFMWATQPALSAAGYVPTIMMERNLYQREINDGLYLPITYYITKWIQEIIVAVPVSMIFCASIYAALGMVGNFGIFWIAYLLTQLTAIAVAYTFAALCPTIDFANGAVPSFAGTLMFFVGYLMPLNKIPDGWIWYSYFDYLRYTFVAMMTNEFRGSDDTEFVCNNQLYDGVLGFYGMRDQAIWWNLLALFGWWWFWVLSAYACLVIFRWSNR